MKSFVLVISVVSISQTQDWMPLSVGNKWLYISDFTSISPASETTRGLFLTSVDSQYTHDTLNYYHYSAGQWLRYDRNKENVFFRVTNDSENIYVNFGDTVGFNYNYGFNSRINIAGSLNIFDSVRQYKGYNSGWIYGSENAQYVRGIGKCNSTNHFRGVGHETNGSSSLIQAIIHLDSLKTLEYSYNIRPFISFDGYQKLTTNKLDVAVAVLHPFSYYGFNFIDTVKMFYNYSKDSLLFNSGNVGLKYISKTSQYFVSLTLDSSLLINGYAFNFRFEAKDKGIIPKFGYSPDKGYYQATLDPVTSVQVDNTVNVYRLEQNFPNPFNPSTNIKFTLEKNDHVILKIFDLLGREIEILVNENLSEGVHTIKWDATNYPNGVYFYTLITNNYLSTKKLLLLK